MVNMMILTCIKIFFARILDVTLGTIRTVFTVRGKVIEPFIIAFFEVIIWFVVAKEALNSSGNTLVIAIFYALGYATGTLIGSFLSKRFIKSDVNIQIVLDGNADELKNELSNHSAEVSVIKLKDNKEMINLLVKNNEIKTISELVNNYDEKAYIISHETKVVHNGLIK